jgi:plasmid replication initiation protein
MILVFIASLSKMFATMFGLKSHRSYDLLREGAKKLMSKSFYVRYENNGKLREVQYHILRKIDYSVQGKEGREEHQEYIDLTIEQEMKPFLLQLQKSFTTYDFQNITQLGVYSIRIYELLKQYESIGSRYLAFEELKRMMELEKEYALFGLFFQKIILKPYIKFQTCFSCSLRSHEKGECGSFFGQSPKNEPPLLLFCERSEQKSLI